MFREFSRVALQKSRKGHRQCESCNNQQLSSEKKMDKPNLKKNRNWKVGGPEPTNVGVCQSIPSWYLA
jgi:hypothetical protein